MGAVVDILSTKIPNVKAACFSVTECEMVVDIEPNAVGRLFIGIKCIVKKSFREVSGAIGTCF